MNVKKFRKIIGPKVEIIEKEQVHKACGSLRPLAELLVEWYQRKLAQEEAEQYGQSK